MANSVFNKKAEIYYVGLGIPRDSCRTLFVRGFTSNPTRLYDITDRIVEGPIT
jgi:hypothetical protein